MRDLSKSEQNAVLISTILASSMAFIDSTALNVALPSIQRSLSVNATQLIWIVNAYALLLSALLLVGGSLGDIYGRNKIFKIGLFIFTVASILCGISINAFLLITFRAFQGIGAALMIPGSLSIITANFSKEKRGWAIGTWSMFSALTTVIGPALGGFLAGIGLWRGIFFINLPLAIIALVYLRKIPETKELNSTRLDVKGALLIILSLASLTYGFIEAPNFGFSHPVIITSFVIGAAGLISFIFHESKLQGALLPLHLFQSKVFSSTNLMTLFIYGSLGGFLFFYPLNLVQIQGYSPQMVGLSLIPLGLLIALFSRWSGGWSDLIGRRPPLIFGPIICTIAYFYFGTIGLTQGPEDFWTTFLLPIILLGIGMGITVAPLTTAVMGAVPQANIGIASGVNNTISRVAGVLAVAIFGALALITFQHELMTGIEPLNLSQEVVQQIQQEATKLAEASPPELAGDSVKPIILEKIRQSFIVSFNQSALIAAILSGFSVFIAFFFINRE